MSSLCSVAVILMLPRGGDAENLAPFTVADSIAMTRLQYEQGFGYASSPAFSFSPDGKRFAAVTYKGNLQTGLNEYELRIYDTEEVLAFVNAQTHGKLPNSVVLAKFETSEASAQTETQGISQVRWSADGESLRFIGRRRAGIGEVYSASLRTGALEQLTSHPDNIVSFAVSPTNERLLYSAYTLPDWSERDEVRGYVVRPGGRTQFRTYHLGKAAPQEASGDPNFAYFTQDLVRGTSTKIDIDPTFLIPQEPFVSPSGALAVVATTIRKIPAHWIDYDFLRQTPVRKGAKTPYLEFESEAFAPPSATQYQLIDLATGAARPLLDAPVSGAAPSVGLIYRMHPQWSADGRHVLLPASYLPFTSGQPDDREHLGRRRVAAEIETATGNLALVCDISARTTKDGRPLVLTDMHYASSDTVVALYKTSTEVKTGASPGLSEVYRRKGNGWSLRSQAETTLVAPDGGETNGRLYLRVSEDLNTAPEIAALDIKSGRERVITDLNPAFRSRTLGHAELFVWKDRLERSFKGGLIFPPDYKAGTRYSVVLQANGFWPDAFLLDSSDDDPAHAARALANRGMLVLQMPDRAVSGWLRGNGKGKVPKQIAFEDYGETAVFMAEVEGAIDALSAKGLIDRERVGLVGFSRNGMYVHYVLAFSKYPIAAATIADSVCLSPFCYTSTYGSTYPGMGILDMVDSPFGGYPSAIAAPFFGSGIEKWIQRSYLFHLDRVRTPIRYEEYGTTQLPGQWESFAILKRHSRPVEMIHIPRASHMLRSPASVYTSRQGNVDWYAFWLNGEEDPDPAKADQYERWRKLRQQLCASISQAEGEEWTVNRCATCCSYLRTTTRN